MACEAKWNWAWEPEDRLPASRVTCDSVVCKRERFSQTPTFEVECGVRECLSFLREHRVLWHETKWLVWTIPPSYWSLSILSHAKTCMQLAGKKWSKIVEDFGRETRSCMNKKRTYMYCKASQMIETIHSPLKCSVIFVILNIIYVPKPYTYDSILWDSREC